MVFKSADFTSQDINWRTCCSSLLWMYFWKSLIIYFGPLSCIMSSNLWPASHIPRWNHVMRQYAVIASLIQFTLHLEQILDIALGKSPPTHTYRNRTSSMFYGWGDTGFCSSFTNTLLNIDQKISNFDLSVQRTLFNCSLFSLCSPWPSGVFWYCFVFSKVVSWHQFCHIGQLLRVFSFQWMLTHFFTILV